MKLQRHQQQIDSSDEMFNCSLTSVESDTSSSGALTLETSSPDPQTGKQRGVLCRSKSGTKLIKLPGKLAKAWKKQSHPNASSAKSEETSSDELVDPSAELTSSPTKSPPRRTKIMVRRADGTPQRFTLQRSKSATNRHATNDNDSSSPPQRNATPERRRVPLRRRSLTERSPRVLVARQASARYLRNSKKTASLQDMLEEYEKISDELSCPL